MPEYVVGLQNDAVPKSAVAMQLADDQYVEHWVLATEVLHDWIEPFGHMSQLCVSQSSMHPVSWLQVLPTYGLTQLKMPCPSWSGK